MEWQHPSTSVEGCCVLSESDFFEIENARPREDSLLDRWRSGRDATARGPGTEASTVKTEEVGPRDTPRGEFSRAPCMELRRGGALARRSGVWVIALPWKSARGRVADRVPRDHVAGPVARAGFDIDARVRPAVKLVAGGLARRLVERVERAAPTRVRVERRRGAGRGGHRLRRRRARRRANDVRALLHVERGTEDVGHQRDRGEGPEGDEAVGRDLLDHRGGLVLPLDEVEDRLPDGDERGADDHHEDEEHRDAGARHPQEVAAVVDRRLGDGVGAGADRVGGVLAVGTEHRPERTVVRDPPAEAARFVGRAACEPEVDVDERDDDEAHLLDPVDRELVLPEDVPLLLVDPEKKGEGRDVRGQLEGRPRGVEQAMVDEERDRRHDLDADGREELHPVLLGDEGRVSEGLVAVQVRDRVVLLLDLGQAFPDGRPCLHRELEEGQEVFEAANPVEQEGRHEDRDGERQHEERERQDADILDVPDHLVVGVGAAVVTPDDAVEKGEPTEQRDQETETDHQRRRAVVGTLLFDLLVVDRLLGGEVGLRGEQVRHVERGVLRFLQVFEALHLAARLVDREPPLAVCESSDRLDRPGVELESRVGELEHQVEEDRLARPEEEPVGQVPVHDQVGEHEPQADPPEPHDAAGEDDAPVLETEVNVLHEASEVRFDLGERDALRPRERGEEHTADGGARSGNDLSDHAARAVLLLLFGRLVCRLLVLVIGHGDLHLQPPQRRWCFGWG